MSEPVITHVVDAYAGQPIADQLEQETRRLGRLRAAFAALAEEMRAGTPQRERWYWADRIDALLQEHA